MKSKANTFFNFTTIAKRNAKLGGAFDSFDVVSTKDMLADFLRNTRIKTASFERFSDRNHLQGKDGKTIRLKWLSAKGTPIDVLANDFMNQYSYMNLDESEIIQDIVDMIVSYPTGVGAYATARYNELMDEMKEFERMAQSRGVQPDQEEFDYTKFEQEIPDNLFVKDTDMKTKKKVPGTRKRKMKPVAKKAVKKTATKRRKSKAAKVIISKEFQLIKRLYLLNGKSVKVSQLERLLVELTALLKKGAASHIQTLNLMKSKLQVSIYKLNGFQTESIDKLTLSKELYSQLENIATKPKVRVTLDGSGSAQTRRKNKSMKWAELNTSYKYDSRKGIELHRFAVGDEVIVKVDPTNKKLWYKGKITKLLTLGAGEQAAYTMTVFGDPVYQNIVFKEASKKKDKKSLGGSFTSEQKQAVKEAELDVKEAYEKLQKAKKRGVSGIALKPFVDGVGKYIELLNKAKGNLPKANARDHSQTSMFDKPKTTLLGYNFEGKNYKRTADLSVKELAALIRIEVEAEFPKKEGFKFSVTVRDHRSIRVTLLDAPFNPFSVPYQIMYMDDITWDDFWAEMRNEYNHRIEKYTVEAKKLLDKIEKFLNQYNFDDSDSQTDYFHTRFYGNVDIEDDNFIAKYYPENKELKKRQQWRDEWAEKTQKKNAAAKEIRESMGNFKKDEVVWFNRPSIHASWNKFLQPNGKFLAKISKMPNGRAWHSEIEVKILSKVTDAKHFELYTNTKNGNTAVHPFTKINQLVSGGTYKLNGDIGEFLGNLGEVDCSMTIKGDQGAGKSQLMWQLIDAFASINKKVAVLSPEMNGNSPTIEKYRNQFISKENQDRVLFTDKKLSAKDIISLAEHFDVVFVDSFNQLEDYKQEQFKEVCSALPTKCIVGIFQSTTSGEMRGGNRPEFDAYVNIEVVKVDDKFVNNYAVCTKNRFGGTGVKYNIHKKKIIKSIALNGLKKQKRKSAAASKVLQLMDKDHSYQDALKTVLGQNKKLNKKSLEKELEYYI